MCIYTHICTIVIYIYNICNYILSITIDIYRGYLEVGNYENFKFSFLSFELLFLSVQLEKYRKMSQNVRKYVACK